MRATITKSQLEGLRVRLCRTLEVPVSAWIRTEDAITRANVGAIVLQEGSRMYGIAWAYSQIMNPQGGERTLVRAMSARELWDRAQSFLNGYEYAQGERNDNR